MINSGKVLEKTLKKTSKQIPDCPFCSEGITDNITVNENENGDSLGNIVSSALIGLIAMKFKNYTKN